MRMAVMTNKIDKEERGVPSRLRAPMANIHLRRPRLEAVVSLTRNSPSLVVHIKLAPAQRHSN